MSLSASLLPEFDHEMANTRKTLERIPADKLTWKPHEKSFTFSELATHMAQIPGWAQVTLKQDKFDMDDPNAPKQAEPKTSVDDILKAFDEGVAGARAALESASDESMMANWSFIKGGQALFTMPRIAVLRAFILSHMIHHRGQMTVYMRLNDVAVPSIYGPSADEDGM